jgi:Right handed beta helix region
VQAHDVSVDGLTVAGSRDGIVLVGTGLPTQVERTVVRDPARFGISVQNGAAELVGNRLQGGPTGIRLRDATGTVRGNEIRGATHYGVSVAGRSAGSAVEANTLSGRGPVAVDTFRLAPHADVVVLGNDVTSWTEDQDDWVYWSHFVPRHPMLVLWVVVLLLPLLASRRARRHRPPLGTPPYRDDLRRMKHLVYRLDGTPAQRAVRGGT